MGLITHALLIPTIVLATIAIISTIAYFQSQNRNNAFFAQNGYNNQLTRLTTESTKNQFVDLRQCNCQILPNCPYYQNIGSVNPNQVQQCGFDTRTFSIQICCPQIPQMKYPDPHKVEIQQSHNHKSGQSPVKKTSTSSTTMDTITTIKYDIIQTAEEDYPVHDIDIRISSPNSNIPVPNELTDAKANENANDDKDEILDKPTDSQQTKTDDDLDDMESISIFLQVQKNIKLIEHKSFKLLPQSTEECGKSTDTDLDLLDIKRKRRRKRVVGGKQTSLKKYPWLVRLFYNKTGQCSMNLCFGCVGTVINRKYILTTAHCAEISSKNPLTIIAGDDHNMKRYEVEEIIAHPDYDNLTKHNDIGLIRMKDNIIFGEKPISRPVCLPFFEAYHLHEVNELPNYKDNELIVAGWGISNRSDMSTFGKELRDAILPEWPISACKKIYFRRNKTIIFHQFCGGADRMTNGDACHGDSGAGIYSQKSMLQLGIVSFGFPKSSDCGRIPGVNTRVIFYLKWILDSIRP